MKTLSFTDAIEDALAQAMANDKRIIILGEDVHMLRVNLFARFGKERVRSTPISESAFLGAAVTRRQGQDSTIASVGVGVHRAIEAATELDTKGISTEVLDLRSVSPLDTKAVCNSVVKTGRLLVVDEDYQGFGLSGELAAIVFETGIQTKYARVCTEDTIPYNRYLEDQTLPSRQRIFEVAKKLMD